MSKLLKILLVGSLLFTPLVKAAPIKIGVAGPFSGAYVAAGDQQWQGAFQAVEDINEKGGINGDKIELVNGDASCDPKHALEAANKMVKNKVIAVVGHNCSASSLIGSKIYHEANIVMITPASTNPSITEKGYQNVFRTCGRDDKQGEMAAKFIVNELKASNIVIVHDDTVYGKGIAQATKAALEKLGAKIVLDESIVPGQTDFSELVDKINRSNADVIYYGGMHFDAGHLLKSIRETKNDIIFFSGDGIATTDFAKEAGGASTVKGVYMTFYDPFSIPQAKKVIKEFQEKRITPDGYTLNAYAAVQAIAAAIENVGKNPKDIAHWLHNNKVDTVIGELEWDEKGDLKDAPYIIYQWNDDGEYERAE